MADNYFHTSELVPRRIYETRGCKSIDLIDSRILAGQNKLRAWCGKPMRINDYMWGGPNEWCGLRTQESPYFKPYSQHTYGRALDSICEIRPEEFHKEIISNPKKYAGLITFIEADINWLHIDCRNTKNYKSNLIVWSPKRGFLDAREYLKELEQKT